ncbi:MAG: uracil-DNA glycosylase [Planctomycetota bacterium]
MAKKKQPAAKKKAAKKAKRAVAYDPAPRALLACTACPRLVAHREAMATTKRKAFADQAYWGRPVPGFGDILGPVLMLGLAPGAHGSNRTGRMFTGDASGDFLFPALHRAGFASQPVATSRDDGMTLRGVFITAAGRCAPPDNKPTRDELLNCRPWLQRDVAAMTRLRVVIALGLIGHTAWLDLLAAAGQKVVKADWKFAHGAEHSGLPGTDVILLDSYHVSAQNTFTGKLTPDMFDAVLCRARELGGLDAPP